LPQPQDDTLNSAAVLLARRLRGPSQRHDQPQSTGSL
jgi:hypothetical protein